MLTDFQVRAIVKFLKESGKTQGNEGLVEAILKHDEYGTHEIIWKDKEIIAYCKYNVEGDTCVVFDAAVKENFRFKSLLKLMLINGLKKFPYITKLRYERELKKRKDLREFSVIKFLNIKE